MGDYIRLYPNVYNHIPEDELHFVRKDQIIGVSTDKMSDSLTLRMENGSDIEFCYNTFNEAKNEALRVISILGWVLDDE